MKTKLTLSISAKRIRRIKAYGLRHRKSVSQLVEEFIDSLEKGAQGPGAMGREVHAMDRFAGMLILHTNGMTLRAPSFDCHGNNSNRFWILRETVKFDSSE